METQPPFPKRGRSPHIFGPYLLWPNGSMDQNGTWRGGRSQPRRLCVRWGPSPRPQKGAEPSIFDPRLLWPNGCMDQDAAWNGGRRRPTRHCVRWGPSSPPQFAAIVRCGQTAGWTKMPLGMEVGLGQGDFVFDGDSATPRKKSTTSIVAKRLDK